MRICRHVCRTHSPTHSIVGPLLSIETNSRCPLLKVASVILSSPKRFLTGKFFLEDISDSSARCPLSRQKKALPCTEINTRCSLTEVDIRCPVSTPVFQRGAFPVGSDLYLLSKHVLSPTIKNKTSTMIH